MNCSVLSEEERNLLWQVGTQYKQDWKKVAKRLTILTGNKRSPNFLMKEYMKLKGGAIESNEPFTYDEDVKLVKLTEELGMNWIKIAEIFGNRGAIKLKNRFYCHLKKKNLLDGIKEEVQRRKSYGEDFISFQENPLDFNQMN